MVKSIAQLVSAQCRCWFYYVGRIPEHADPEAVDRKLIAKYQIPLNKDQAYRQRKAGRATARYLRYQRTFVLLSTHGQSVFLQERQFKDLRREPMKLFGYSIAHRKGKASVRIEAQQFQILEEHFRSIATSIPCEALGREINELTFYRFKPVVKQLLALVRAVNEERAAWGLAPLDRDAVVLAKRPIPVFE